MFRRVLVGFDGSLDAHEALRAGKSLADATDGEVAVLIVVSSSHGETDEDRQRAFETGAAPLRAAAEAELRSPHSSQTAGEVHLTAGDRPARALADYAKEGGFDVVVVGRHGRERASHAGLGRMARELAEKAPCPVLLVGERNHDAE